MNENETSIISYDPAFAPDLLRLLLELQSDHFKATASIERQELEAEKDIRNSYQKYIDSIHQSTNDTWKVLLAKDADNNIVGFIIGSIENDEDLVQSRTGKFEDWYVTPSNRGKGIGLKLYVALEKWFKERGCARVASEIWLGNDISVSAHKRLGFFVSGINLLKKL